MRGRLSIFLVVAFLAASALGDYNLDIPYPYNCSRISYCNTLRTYTPDAKEIYTAKYNGVNQGAIEFILNNTNGNTLLLNIWGIENQRYRVIIEEPDQHRYKLQHSLAQDPTVRQLAVVDTTNTNFVLAEDGAEDNQVKINLKPFSIEFWKGGVLVQTFNGSRLVMQNTNDSQAFAFSLAFSESYSFMGLHEHADWLNLRHTADQKIDPYRLRNTDYGATRYDVDTTESMYGSVPVLYSFGGTSNINSGVFVHNAAEMYIEINNKKHEAYFMVEGGTLDFFVLLGPSLQESVKQYLNLTGHPHLPQLWALGYHQCRWAYNTTQDVQETIMGFDNASFPLDVLWLDIEYTSERKWFTWNISSFPDPIDMLDWVDAQGHRKIVPISDPHIKIDENYPVYVDARDQHLFIKDEQGQNDYVSLCWPGNVSWIDYLNPTARDFYAKQHLYENFPSTSTLGGFWNDMNEPTLFDNLPERSAPYEVTHYGGVKHRDVHNIYATLQTMSTHSGLMERDQGKLRPFILTRAFFAGGQRYALKWSGDNWGQYDNLRISVPMALTANLAGIAFYGADIPGFNLPDSKPDEELYVRWYQTGIWLPFFRAHANMGVPRREPFRFSEPNQKILHDVMGLRYKHLPYWYTLFYEHVRNGDPIVKPLLFDYPLDNATYLLNDQWLVGSNILTASVYQASCTKVNVYFPGGATQLWFQITGDKKVYKGAADGKAVSVAINGTYSPVFYKGGSIIPRRETLRRSSTEMRNDPHTLYVVLDANKQAKGTVYIDDYESFEYQDKNNCLYLTLSYNGKTNKLSVVEDQQCKPVGLVFEIASVQILTANANGTAYSQEERPVTIRHPLVKKAKTQKL